MWDKKIPQEPDYETGKIKPVGHCSESSTKSELIKTEQLIEQHLMRILIFKP